MGYIAAWWVSINPFWKMIGLAILAGLLIAIIYIYWPTGDSAVEKALKEQNAALAAENVELQKAAAQLKAESDAQTQRAELAEQEVTNLENQIPAIRQKARSARSAGRQRADTIAATPDSGVRDVLLSQWQRTRSVVGDVSPDNGGTDTDRPQPR